MSGAQVRTVGDDPRDRAALAALRRAWTEENAGGPVVDDGFEAAFADWWEHEGQQRVCWLAELGGRALLEAAVAHADAHGFARLVLVPTERSVPFYARAGFVPATTLMVRPGR